MYPSILVVENNRKTYERLISILDAIPDEDKRAWKIENLKYVYAACVQEANTAFEDVTVSGRPFDLLVLDLSIPFDRDGLEGIDNGFDVLADARKLRAAKQIVIYTRFQNDRNILRALRDGAADFVKKPNLDEPDQQLQNRFLACWQRLLENESANLLDERIKNLVPYAESGLAQRFTACFSSFLQKVAHTAEDVEHYAVERFGLDPKKDEQDFLIRCLKNQNQDLKAVQQNWMDLNADLTEDGAMLKPLPLKELLDNIGEKWAPCLRVKNCEYDNTFQNQDLTGVLTFRDDVRIIVQEIIAGTLSTLPDYGEKRSVTVTARIRNGQAEIQFADDLADKELRLSVTDSQAINDGSILGPDHGPKRFGRAWGLSVAQHLALRGGGRLIAKPQPGGNIITYFAPLLPANGNTV